MQVPIESIVMDERVRKDLGDLSALMASLQKYGQLNPVIMTRDCHLIAGHRRLESARRLGWVAVEALAVDRDTEVERLEIELQENVHRKDLSPEELVAGYTRLEKLKSPSAWRRIGDFFRHWFNRLFRRGKKRPLPVGAASVAPPSAALAVRTEEDRPGDYGV